MVILTHRNETTVTATDAEGALLRSFQCTTVQGAVDLAEKLRADPVFAERWATSIEWHDPTHPPRRRRRAF